jgi:hypothetical protein
MHRALWKLLRLRAQGGVRRIYRNAKTPRGAALTALGALAFILWMAQILLTGRAEFNIAPEHILQWAPLGLFLICIIQLLVASGERGIVFSPAEINFLFAGPFKRREILLYKIVGGLGGCMVMSAFFSLFGRRVFEHWFPAYLGIFLTVLFMYLFATALGVAGQLLAAKAYTHFRKGAIAVILIAAGIYLYGRVVAIETIDVLAAGEAITTSPAYLILLAPFQIFVRVMLAETGSVPFALWSVAGIGINAAVVLAIIGIDRNFMEASLVSSKKTYERLQRFQRGGSLNVSRSRTARLRIPMLPRLGGAGTIARKQLIGAVRCPGAWMVGVLVPATGLILGFTLGDFLGNDDGLGMGFLIGMSLYATFMLSTMIRFDFRSELETMERLKSLPLPASAVAVGELAVPILISTSIQLALCAPYALYQGEWLLLAALVAFAPPLNALMFAIENFFFVLYPMKRHVGHLGDPQFVGRQILLLLTKFSALSLCLGVVGGVGFLTNYLLGILVLTMGVAWVILTFFAALSFPCVAWAFSRFDPSIHTP